MRARPRSSRSLGYAPPTDVVWNPAANPSGTGKWNENANWTGGVAPASVTKVNFNVVGAIPCTVTNAALADYVVMGDNGPGGTLIITNGGSLTCGSRECERHRQQQQRADGG